MYQCLYTTILAREVDFSKMKKDSLKIEDVRGGGGGGGVRDLGHLRTRGGGGSKSGQILRTSFMYGPLHLSREEKCANYGHAPILQVLAPILVT